MGTLGDLMAVAVAGLAIKAVLIRLVATLQFLVPDGIPLTSSQLGGEQLRH